MIVGLGSTTPAFADYADGYRTEQALTLPNAVKVWRQDAWRLDDFYAQIRLGDLYSQNQSFPSKESSKNPSFYDPVEAYVWYFMALRPDHPYAFDDNSTAYQNLYATRSNALHNIQEVYFNLTFDQRLDARARILYILSSRGAEGFMTLGRLHGVGMTPGPCCAPPTDSQIVLCMQSNFDNNLLGRVWWRFWTFITGWLTGDTYPHPPVWRQVDNTPLNVSLAYPDGMCMPPKPPLVPTGGLPYSNGYSPGAAVSLNGGAGGNPLPVSPPTVSINSDPRSAMQGQEGSTNGNTDAVPLTPQSQPMGQAGGGYSGYSGYGGGGDPAYGGDRGGGGYGAGYGNGYGGNGYDNGYGGGGNGGGYGNGYGGGGYGNGYGGGGYGNGYGGGGYGGGNYDNVPSVFVHNWAEALTYYRRAEMLGHPLADGYAAAIRYSINSYNPDGAKIIIAEAEKRARYWSAPYEFYQGQTAGGMPHSDESLPSLEQRIALGRVGEMPCCAIAEALDFRRYTMKGRGCGPPPLCLRRSIAQFQGALGYEQTGVLTPLQVVRLIQMAAVDGDAAAQDRLGIMYAKGVGVPQNFVRAEKWFINAANQHNADALFNLYVLYKVGPNGIEQDEHKATTYYVQAMAARYNVLLCELQDLLRQADDRHDHPNGARR